MWESPEHEALKDMIEYTRRMREYLARLSPDTMNGEQARQVLEVFSKVERVGAAGTMIVAPRIEECLEWRQQGHKSAANFLAEKIGASVGTAGGVLETARQLGELPATAACLRNGDFSVQQIREIASAATVHPAAEEELLEAAARSGLKSLKTRCERIKAIASWEMGEMSRENAIRKSRFLRHYNDPDGGVRLVGRFTPADGARLMEAVRAKAGYFFDEARKAGCYETMSAYCADALVSLADDAMVGRGTGIARPSVILRVNLEALQRGELEKDDEVCEIPGVGSVSLATATRALGDAYVKIVIADGVWTSEPSATRDGPSPPISRPPSRNGTGSARCHGATTASIWRTTTSFPSLITVPPRSTTWCGSATGTTT